jgi:hypothetical protein
MYFHAVSRAKHFIDDLDELLDYIWQDKKKTDFIERRVGYTWFLHLVPCAYGQCVSRLDRLRFRCQNYIYIYI